MSRGVFGPRCDEMRAVVLVGGFGTRLRPLTLTMPKQMLPVVDRPMIERVVAGLGAAGVTEVVLSLGYKPDAFLAAYPDDMCAGVRLAYAVESEPLDTAGAVRFAAMQAGIDDTFLVLNGDVLTDLDVGELCDLHRSRGALGTIALTRVQDPSRYGVVPVDDEGRVLDFVEKPPPGTAPTDWINAGTYVLEPSVLDRIPDGRRVSIERETFPAMVLEGSLFALESDSYWIDAGTPETYLQVQLDLIDGVRGSAERAVAADAVVPFDCDVDHSVVMSGVSIEPGAIVHDSVVMPGAVIGNAAVVENSIVGPGAVIGDRAELTELTVIGMGEVVGAGCVLRAAKVPSDQSEGGS